MIFSDGKISELHEIWERRRWQKVSHDSSKSSLTSSSENWHLHQLITGLSLCCVLPSGGTTAVPKELDPAAAWPASHKWHAGSTHAAFSHFLIREAEFPREVTPKSLSNIITVLISNRGHHPFSPQRASREKLLSRTWLRLCRQGPLKWNCSQSGREPGF